MPYIESYKQELLDKDIDSLVKKLYDEHNSKVDYGALEYTIFRLVQLLTEPNRRFEVMNALVGTIETSKSEYIERIMKPYESLKLIDNWKPKKTSNKSSKDKNGNNKRANR